MFYEQLFLLSISDHLFYKIHYLKNKYKFENNYPSPSLEYSLELSELSLPNDDSFEFLIHAIIVHGLYFYSQ